MWLVPALLSDARRAVQRLPGEGGGRESGPALGFARELHRISDEAARGAAELGTRDGFGPLPHLTAIRRSFGRHDVSDARAHQGPRAAAASRSVGARAFTAGGDVVFAGSPDLRTAAHEAAHVVQQRAGVRLAGPAGAVGDRYERHADAVAERVVRGESAEALLGDTAARGSKTAGAAWQGIQLQRGPSIDTDYGQFYYNLYLSTGRAGSEYGLGMEVEFDPDKKKVDATKIGLVQAARVRLGGAHADLLPAHANLVVPSGVGAGWQIDRQGLGSYGNPLYATKESKPKEKLGDTATEYFWGQHGWNYTDATGTLRHEVANIFDEPNLVGHGNNAGQEFETAALAVEGTQSGTYMGSVTWGWTVDDKGKFTQLPLALKSKGDPSKEFVAAAEQWNKSFVGGTVKTVADPTNVYDATPAVGFTVPKGTEVKVDSVALIKNDVVYDLVDIQSGPNAGSAGLIKVNDMKETGGQATLPLPIPAKPATPTSAPAMPPKKVKRKWRWWRE